VSSIQRVNTIGGIAPKATGNASIAGSKIRALAVTSAERSAELAELPTIAESGLAGYEYTPWQGIAAPAGTRREIIERLHGAIVKIMSTAEAANGFWKSVANPRRPRPRVRASRAVPLRAGPSVHAARRVPERLSAQARCRGIQPGRARPVRVHGVMG
jgi:hypothetical protein